MLNNIRIEEDLLNTREVPTGAYYDAHTLRAIENFYISNNKISGIPEFVHGMVIVKKATTMANEELQTTSKSVADVIIAVCDEVLNNGRCMDQFPVNVYQGGAGTPVNMNTNEVLANIDLELVGHQKGEYQYLNLNDHVNKCQSTNDACPAGFRIAVYASAIRLANALNQLREGFEKKIVEFQNILKMGRTQLRDAALTTLGRGFYTFSVLLKEEMKNINRTAGLLLEVNLGVTAVGTGLNTPKEYPPLAVQKLAKVIGFARVPAEDLTEATSDYGAYVVAHGALKRLAVKMSKICNDLRLPSSDPYAGLNETNLSELRASLSIIPAKVSPAVPEVINQACFKVIDNNITVTMTSEAGQLQLSVVRPVIGQAMSESIHILNNVCYNPLEKYASGITTNKEVCEAFVLNSISIITYLNPFIGHHSGDIIGKICAETGKSVYEVVLEHNLLTGSELDNIFSAQGLIHPAYKAKRYTDKSEQ